MATLAERLKRPIFKVKGLVGKLGFRPHTVTLLQGYRASLRTRGEVVRTPIVEGDNQPPKVRWLKDEEIAVGGLAAGTVEIGPITPLFAAGGTDIRELQGKGLTPGDDILIWLEGPMVPHGAAFEITSILAHKALRIMLQCKPVEQGEDFGE